MTLFVPEASISAYQQTAFWRDFTIIYAEQTDMSALADSEFDLLRAIYNKTNGAEWTEKWTFGATKAETPVLKGVKMSQGHVMQLVLNNNNLSGSLPVELFQFPQAWYINVSGNNFSGKVEDTFNNIDPNETISYLDLSDNQLTGNIGAISQVGASVTDLLPSLTTLKAYNNHIRDVKPALPSHIKTLDLSGQTIDETYRYSDFLDTPQEQLQYFFPTVVLYQHGNNSYSNNAFVMTQPEDEHPWAILLYKYSNSSNTYYYNNMSTWNYAPAGQAVWLGNYSVTFKDQSRFKLTFDFEKGDVNYDNLIDISDLQRLINFAIYPEDFSHHTPFNYNAANTMDDETINVQDVVCEVNLLLDQNIVPELARGERKMEREEKSGEREDERKEWRADGFAILTIENGQIILESEVPVAALDLSLSPENKGNADWEWSSSLSPFTRAERNGRTIFYSLFGDELPSGRTVLGSCPVCCDGIATTTTCRGHATLTIAKLSDRNGRLIPVRIVDGSETTWMSRSVGVDFVGAPTYDLLGRQVANGKLPQGVYVINGKKVVK